MILALLPQVSWTKMINKINAGNNMASSWLYISMLSRQTYALEYHGQVNICNFE